MTPQQFDYIQQLFLRLREMSPDQRALELAQEDDLVRREVDSLLLAEEGCGTFLEKGMLRDSLDPATKVAHKGLLDAVDSEFGELNAPPKNVGKYRLLQKIGEGGHGTVFMAEQTEPIVRKVAVKLIKAGMDSKQVLARFHAEQQALAMMDHPSIARVLDAGTTKTGSPYFVMELVKGISIHDFCEQNSSSLTERLNLFLQVCDAVHHAHRKGVIHRDLKPSNVLVTMGEAEPLVKVIDFGIAKALDSRLTERTLFTEYGQMIGTLEYMSPEQAEMSAVDIDTRSDVYSLGVLLYQLLTGETPITKDQLLSKGLLEISRQIRDTEPVKPSSRITKRHPQSVRSRSEINSNKERGLLKLPSSDLDWITMKALAKDRRRRYDSALDFGRDINRFLDGQPVDAHPPSPLYKLAKLARRHRLIAITSLLIAASCLLGIIGLSVGLGKASESLRIAEQHRDQSRQAQHAADNSARRLSENMYSDLVQSAWRATETHNTVRAQELLDSCLPEMRGWEWEFVSRRNHVDPHSVLREQGNSPIVQIRKQRTSNIAACVLDNGNVEIRDRETNQLLQRLDDNLKANAAEFTDDGSKLIVGTTKGELIAYQTSDWKLVRSKNLGHGGIYSVDVSPNGDRIAICTGGGFVEVLDASFNLLETWHAPSRAANVAMLDGTDRLVASGLDGNAYMFEMGSETIQDSFVSESSLQQLAWIDERRLAVVTSGAAVAIDLDKMDGRPEELIRGNGIGSAIATDHKHTVFLGCSDGSLIMRKQNEEQRSIEKFNVAITALATDKNSLLVALSDGRWLRMKANGVKAGWEPVSESPTTASVFLDLHDLAIALDDTGQIHPSRISNGEPLSHSKVQAHQEAAWALSHDQAQTLLATVGEDQRLRCWNLPSLKLRFERTIDWGVRDVCVSPNGSWIAAAPPAGEQLGQREGTIGIWDARTGECLQQLEGHDNWVLKMSTTPDGSRLISSCENRTTRIWNVERATAMTISPQGKSPVLHHAFDPTGSELYLGHRDGWVTGWNLQDGTPIATWSAFGDSITGLAITQGNRILATSRSSEVMRVHDLKTASTIAEFDLGFGYLQNLQLSKNEKRIAITTQDRHVLMTGSQ